VLILVISVMTGFDRELRQKVIDFDAHILVSSEECCAMATAQNKDDNTPGVVATAPYIQGPVIVEFQSRRLAPLMRASIRAGGESDPAAKIHQVRKLDLDGESTWSGSSSRENYR